MKFLRVLAALAVAYFGFSVSQAIPATTDLRDPILSLAQLAVLALGIFSAWRVWPRKAKEHRT